MAPQAMLAAALAAAAWAAAVYDCRRPDGRTRLTDQPCREEETLVSSRTLSGRPSHPAAPSPQEPLELEAAEPETSSAGLAPGLRSDGAGGALGFGGTEWALVNTLTSYRWSEAEGWKAAGPVREQNRRALRHAVEQFNAIPGLRLKLRYEERDDPAYSIAQHERHRDEFVVFWGEDAPKGGLTRPFNWTEKYGYKGGTSTFLKDKDGRPVSTGRGPLVIAGAAIYARERIGDPTDLGRCRQDAPYYAFLHEVGHALGLGHGTPGPSIMRGTCGMSYLPNDVANLRRLYGER